MSNDYYSLSNLVKEFIAQVLLGQSLEEQIHFLKVYAPEYYQTLKEKYSLKEEEEEPRVWVEIGLPQKVDSFTLMPIEEGGPPINLSPDSLENVVLPVIHALYDIQQVLDRLNGILKREIRIRHISQRSPIEVKIEGISDILQTIDAYVTPKCKERAEAHIASQMQTKQAHIAQMESDLAELKNKRQVDKEAAHQVALGKRITEIEESLKAEGTALLNLRRQEELAPVELAATLVKHQAIDPDQMTEHQKTLFIMRLAEPLRILLHSPALIMKA